MLAVSLKERTLALREVSTPVPGSGQLLVRTLACAICASDHHYMDHPEVAQADRSGMRVAAPHTDVVLGHEYCAELVAYGPDTRQEWPIGTRLTSPPALFTDAGMRIIGMAPDAPGGFGEYFLLSEGLARVLPDDLPPERLALIDAMAVGWYYTRVGSTGDAATNSVPLVVGLGAIGLSVVAALRRRGIGPIVASDFSESRRKLALEMGADIVVDPANGSPWAEWRSAAWGHPEEVHDRIALMGKPTQVIYECVGVPGVLADILENCGQAARLLSAGGAASDTIPSAAAKLKGVNIQFGGGPAVTDWYETLDLVVDGSLDPTPLIGETVPLADLADAIDRARSSAGPVRILYVADPLRTANSQEGTNEMTDDIPDPYDRGLNVLRDVYAGDVVTLPEGTMAFNDVMVQTLFDQVWRREVLDVRSRRLLLMGVIAANGQVETWKIQARAALRRGELTADELRETLIMLAPYAGYPNISGLVVPCEEVIGAWIADGSPGWEGENGPEED